MKRMLWLLSLSGYIITAHCSFKTIVANPGGIGGIYKGPDSETIVHGPDGSIITSQQKGGIIQTEQKLQPIIVAEPEVAPISFYLSQPTLEIVPESWAPNSVTPGVPLEPVITGTAVPSIATAPVSHTIDIVEPDPHIIETEIIDAPAVEPKESTDLVGPSGSISTRGSESIVSGPASTTITKTAKILVAPPVISGIPVVASLSTPIHSPPLVEVNNELPISPRPLNPILPSAGPILSTTVSPLSLGTVGISTAVPPLSVGSTLAPPLINYGINLFPNNSPKIIPLDGVGVGYTIAPPIIRQPLPLGQEADHGLVSNDGSEYVRQGLLPTNPPLLRPYTIGSTERPKLLTGEQYDERVDSDNLAPNNGILPGVQYESVRPGTLLTPVQHPIEQPSIISPTFDLFKGVVQSTSVNVLDEGTSGFRQNNEVQSTTFAPEFSTLAAPSNNILPPRRIFQNIPQEWLLNRQLVIDPAQIPQHNIVPPEIGIPKGAIDLGTLIQTHSTSEPRSDLNGYPRATGLLPTPNIQKIDSSNIQRLDTDRIPTEVERTFQNGYYQSEVVVGNTENEVYPQPPLLSRTNPIQPGIGIPPRGILGSELSRAGIDSSQIQLTNIPLSDVSGLQTGLQSSRPVDYDDSVSASLWNRYGRRRRNKKP